MPSLAGSTGTNGRSLTDVAIREGKDIVTRLIADQAIANASWSHVTALHHAYSEPQSVFKNTLDRLELTQIFFSAADAFIRDTLLALFRLTDDPNEERITVCCIAKILHDTKVQAARVSKCDTAIIPCGEMCQRKIDSFLSVVPKGWRGNPKLKDPRLTQFRAFLRPIRDKLIAHAQPFQTMQLPIAQIDDFRMLTGQLVRDAQWIFCGSAPSDPFQARLKRTTEFWNYIQEGFLVQKTADNDAPNGMKL